MPIEYLWLLPLGLLIGAFGTLIGAGGGFILVPILLLLYPKEPAELVTAISLAVVFFNALSGSFAYTRMKRVDYKSGIFFSIATIPGAVMGALATAYIPRRIFHLMFGVLMIIGAIMLWLSADEKHSTSPNGARIKSTSNNPRLTERHLVDAEGTRYDYAFDLRLGIVISVFVGFISSLLGVGGGFIHVPALAHLLNFPVHIATGVFIRGVRRLALLAIGVLIGAQVGAWMSNRVGGKSIIRALAVALAFVGIRLILSHY